MTVADSGDYVIRQTKQRFNYQSGKSHLVVMTGLIGNPSPDTLKRIGYFNSDTTGDYSTGLDGLLFESNGSSVYVACYKSGTERFRIAQSSWNLDTMDGNGPSEINIDWTKAQIFFMDFEWLGVGRTRFGLYVNGLPYYVHENNNANEFENVYMSSPNHSLRYEIRSTGGSDSLLHICSSVASEGGIEEKGSFRSVSTNGAVTVGNGANECILAIRLKDDYDDITAYPVKLRIFNESGNDDLRWYFTQNATLTTPLTEGTSFTSLPNSSLEYTIPDDTVTDEGTIVAEGFITAGGDADASNTDSAIRMGRKIDGTRDIWYLCVDNFGSTGTSDNRAAISFRELL
jgi:hypothetical protein